MPATLNQPHTGLTRYGFADRMEQIDAAIRRDRRPLPSHDLNTDNYRRWARAVLHAEVKHAVDDFWRCANALGAGLVFDDYHRAREAAPYRFDHERKAETALHWLDQLNLHDGTARDPWSHWTIYSRERRREWARERWQLKQKFSVAMGAYLGARVAYQEGLVVVVRQKAAA
jgi:hypothetical protein